MLSLLLLVVAPSVLALSPFPRVHPRGQLGDTALSTSFDASSDASFRADERSVFALHSPKSLLARRTHARLGRALEHAKRAPHDITDAYGALPELTDPTAIVSYSENGYGNNADKTLMNGYGSVPETLDASNLGLAGLVKRDDEDEDDVDEDDELLGGLGLGVLDTSLDAGGQQLQGLGLGLVRKRAAVGNDGYLGGLDGALDGYGALSGDSPTSLLGSDSDLGLSGLGLGLKKRDDFSDAFGTYGLVSGTVPSSVMGGGSPLDMTGEHPALALVSGEVPNSVPAVAPAPASQAVAASPAQAPSPASPVPVSSPSTPSASPRVRPVSDASKTAPAPKVVKGNAARPIPSSGVDQDSTCQMQVRSSAPLHSLSPSLLLIIPLTNDVFVHRTSAAVARCSRRTTCSANRS